MSSVVFLRAINVGGANRCSPAAIARELKKFDIVNIGAVGTFVVRNDVDESALRNAIARKLPFKCEIIICPGRDILRVADADLFAGHPSGPMLTQFANVLARRLTKPPPLPLQLPSADDWMLKVIAIRNQLVLGIYRREMKAISFLGKLEKLLGVPATNRSWNTMERVIKVLRDTKKNRV